MQVATCTCTVPVPYMYIQLYIVPRGKRVHAVGTCTRSSRSVRDATSLENRKIGSTQDFSHKSKKQDGRYNDTVNELRRMDTGLNPLVLKSLERGGRPPPNFWTSSLNTPLAWAKMTPASSLVGQHHIGKK